MKRLYWFLLLLPFGCNGVYHFNTDVYKRKVVVESFLSPYAVISVKVSWNMQEAPDNRARDWGAETINGARVEIKEDGVVILNGTTVDGVLTSDIYPSVGKKYTLSVQVEGQPELTAATSIPPPADMHYSVREKWGASPYRQISDSKDYGYLSADVSRITLPQEAPAIWIYGHVEYEHGGIGPFWELFSNCPYLDQVNATTSDVDVHLRESYISYERGFIRIQRSALSLAVPFTFTGYAAWEGLRFFVVQLYTPSEEYDRFQRSAIKQDIAKRNHSHFINFINDPQHIFSNIRNGTGIFAGFNVRVVAVPIQIPE